jgi:iron complex outermembrane receptor protein
MNMKLKPVAAAVWVALAGAHPAFAQQAPVPETKETVTVVGIRASIEKSLDTKRNADTVTEVITAEDIGKLPDKNIADAVQRLPGVTISSAAGGEGGFDENDRVSLRGTNPSLTQTLVNGHMISSGDWFVLDQVGLVGRSVSFSMLPTELVSQVIVRKSQTADMVEGGVAGAVDIITRTPLGFAKPVTIAGSVGTVYSDLPEKWDPQASLLVNWKNPANTFGIMLQGFYQERHLRRDGQEILGYGTIDPTSALARAKPDLAGVAYPTLIGSAFFEQERKRKGGLIGVEARPTNDVTLHLESFYSKLDATNYNRNWMMWGSHIIGTNQVPTSYTVNNGTLTAATWPNAGTPGNNAQYAIVDQIYRPGSYSQSEYTNLDGTWRANDRLTLTGQVGTTRGKGVTPKQAVFEGDVFNTGATYNMHGIGSPVDVAFPNGNPSVFTGTSLDWIFGASPAATHDKERYGRADGEWAFDRGWARNLKGGIRYAEHTRDTQQVAQGPNFAANPFDPANLPHWNGETYPSNFASGLGGNFPKQPWMLSPDELNRWGDIYSNRDPVTRQYWPGEFALKEKDSAAYVMATFEGTGWSGNAGVRFVKTKEEVTVNVAVPGDVCAPLSPCPSVPGAITTSAFGTFYKNLVANTYNDVLPSANLRFDLGRGMVGRLAAARVMARPDFSALGGSITADDITLTGNGGNPNLKPIRSNNFDASWEWYFAPRALVSVAAFYMDLDNYVAFGTHQQELFNIRNHTFATYTISSPINSSGKAKGVELAWYQPLAYGFGFEANYTYTDAKENKNCASNDVGCQNAPDVLLGASKNTYNVTGYYEDHGLSARLAYTYRSAFFVGLDRSTPQFQDDTGTLAASLGYQINKQFAVYFDALNLNNPTLKYYAANKDQPRAFYENGRQYYLSLRIAL